MDYPQIREYIGHMDQLFSLRESTLRGGRQQGTRAVELHNGGELGITVLQDRCMDLYQVRYRGKNLNYIGPAGILAPSYYSARGKDFLDSFFCGFLTTCGLSNIGSPCRDGDRDLGLHGGLSGLAAEQATAQVALVEGVPTAILTGRMREGTLFGGNLTLRRVYQCRYGEDVLRFTDEICNEGYETVPLQILYHFNMGYPLLSEAARLRIPSKDVQPRTPWAKEHLDRWAEVTPPAAPYEEMCYFHTLRPDAGGRVTVGIDNPAEDLSVEIDFDGALLDHFVQWKMLGKGEYAMGLEPCNSSIEGRPTAREDGSLKFIEPGQRIVYTFELRFSSANETRRNNSAQ